MDASSPPSATDYRGRLGQTQKQLVHWVCSGCGVRANSELYNAVNLGSDPALREVASKLELNRLRCVACGAETAASLPVIFHEPSSALFALWLPDSLAHQELPLRAQLLQDLAADQAPLPRYVAQGDVLVGALALQRWLAAAPPGLADEAGQGEMTAADAGLAAPAGVVAEADKEPQRCMSAWVVQQQQDLACQWRQLEEQRQLLRDQAIALAGRAPLPPQAASPENGVQSAEDYDGLAGAPEHEIDTWRASDKLQLLLQHSGQLYLLAKVEGALANVLAAGPPVLLLQLRDLPRCPLLVLILVPAAEQLLPDAQRALYWFIDPLAPETAPLLELLANDFAVVAGIYDEEARHVASFRLRAPLGENLALIEARLQKLLRRREPAELDFAGAVEAYQASGDIRLGLRQGPLVPLGHEPLTSCAEALRATRILRYWARPENIEYLVLIKSFPLERWREQQQRVICAALEWGLPLGPELGQKALELELAESWPQLVGQTVKRFAAVSRKALPHDLTFAEEWQIWQQHQACCAQHGLLLAAEERELLERAAECAGLFAGDCSLTADLATYPEASLVELLADPIMRRDAALELCAREASHLSDRIFAAVCQMSLPEVFRVMPALASVQNISERLFLAGLKHRKTFVRQACVLALAVQKPATALEPLVDLLLEEPTSLWIEAAKVLSLFGDAGREALLARRRSCGSSGQERLALALSGDEDAPGEREAAGDDRTSLGQELTAQFQRALATEVKELCEGDIVEQEEVLDASDIVDEEVEVVEEDILDPPER